MEIREPKTKEELDQYYDLRYQVLRKPWNQPKCSEKDDKEDESIHIIAIENNKILGVGRVHLVAQQEAQIRYMGVDPSAQGKGVGRDIIRTLEDKAKAKGAKTIFLNARETVTSFYEKQGYTISEKSHILFGNIQHYTMRKTF